MTRSADARAARTFRECSLVRLGDAKVPPLSRLVGITVVAYYQALLPDYARYARRLAAVRARDPTLAGVAQAARSLGRHYASVRTAHPDYCHALRLWRAAHWTKSFSVMAAIGVSRRVFDERAYPQLPVILREEVTVATSGDRLRDLGLGEAGVRAFLLATDAFAAARGGYTEVVNLARR